MAEFDKKYSEEIQRHLTAHAYTDRKFSGCLLGTGIFGLIGFLAFNGAVSYGFGGCTYKLSN